MFNTSEYATFYFVGGDMLSLDEIKNSKDHPVLKKQHPKLDIRFIFENYKRKLRKGAKSTYAEWCEKYGFLYDNRVIPEAWLKEKGKVIYPKFIAFTRKKIVRK